MPQISLAYWSMVRSELNLPLKAVEMMEDSVQPADSVYAASTRSCDRGRRRILTDEEVVTSAETFVAFERTQEFFELVTKHAATHVLARFRETRIRDELACRAFARRFNFGIGDTEQEEVILTNALSDFNVRTIEGTDDQATIHLELHVGSTGGFGARGGDVLRKFRRRDQRFSQGNVVIRDEDNLEEVTDLRVVVHNVTDVVDESDDALGLQVSGVRLAAEDADARHAHLARSSGVIAFICL